MSILSMQNIKKSFGRHQVLKDISFSVDEGEVVSIIGPSGSGKSTLLRCATFLETIDSGVIAYNDKPVTSMQNGKCVYVKDLNEFRKCFGLVFQNFNLFPHYTVLKNMMDAPVSVLGRDKEEVRAECMELLKKMGLEDRAEFYPCQLSGGQQQRVAIARAIVKKPTILIADEPTGNLDPVRSLELMLLFEKINELGTTVLVVTHEKELVNALSKRVIAIDSGRIVSDGNEGYYSV